MTDGAQGPTEPTGTLAVALDHAVRLLSENPALAEEQAREILKSVPGQLEATLILAKARRRSGDPKGAKDAARDALAVAPRSAEAHFELGLAHAALGKGDRAIKELERAVTIAPGMANAWRALGDQLTLAGETEAADRAYARHIASESKDPELMRAGAALAENDIPVAEHLLRNYLKRHPTDVMAIRMLAEVASRLRRYADAEALLERCMELAPSFTAARHNLALVQLRLGKPEEVLKQMAIVMKADPRNPNYRMLRSAALVRVGEYDEAIAIYETLLKDYPRQAKSWMSFGHALKTVGRQDDAIAAYRKSIDLQPSLGEAYWSLANLKTVRFADDDLDKMRAQLERDDIEEEDRLHLHFALGKALEDAERYEESFRHYEKGNDLRQQQVDYMEEEASRAVTRIKSVFTRDFFAARAGHGSKAPDPIFVLGMPRSGSTLIEQILSSHSLIEGTMELPDIIAMTKRFGGRAKRSGQSRYPEIVAELTPEQLKELGDEYIERTRIQRKTGKPFFIDKMPNNFLHAGFIHLILPKAKIIDARRHPMACCFSNFKQHFAKGQGFSYGLERIGRYYSDYVDLMRHFDEAMPGVVHRVIYEQMVEDTEREVRRLLDYCGLPFEEACLRFYETDRAVRTASSEQVRKPIFTEGLDQWRNYEAWLDPLKGALGPLLAAYPNAP
jgi:tetratricopeptide (TPR) repeat protein